MLNIRTQVNAPTTTATAMPTIMSTTMTIIKGIHMVITIITITTMEK
jgi:hypothetical protein